MVHIGEKHLRIIRHVESKCPNVGADIVRGKNGDQSTVEFLDLKLVRIERTQSRKSKEDTRRFRYEKPLSNRRRQ